MTLSFKQIQSDFDEPFRKLEEKLENQINNLIEDNLLIPGLVGEHLPFKNLRSYLSSNHTNV